MKKKIKKIQLIFDIEEIQDYAKKWKLEILIDLLIPYYFSEKLRRH